MSKIKITESTNISESDMQELVNHAKELAKGLKLADNATDSKTPTKKPTTVDGLINLAEYVYSQIKHPELAPNGIKIADKGNFIFALENLINKKLDTPEAIEKAALVLTTLEQLNKVNKGIGEIIAVWALPKDGMLQNEQLRTHENINKWRVEVNNKVRTFLDTPSIPLSEFAIPRETSKFEGDRDPKTLFPKDSSEDLIRIMVEDVKKVLPKNAQTEVLFADLDRVFPKGSIFLINIETAFYIDKRTPGDEAKDLAPQNQTVTPSDSKITSPLPTGNPVAKKNELQPK
jgi:hypothetical protein